MTEQECLHILETQSNIFHLVRGNSDFDEGDEWKISCTNRPTCRNCEFYNPNNVADTHCDKPLMALKTSKYIIDNHLHPEWFV